MREQGDSDFFMRVNAFMFHGDKHIDVILKTVNNIMVYSIFTYRI